GLRTGACRLPHLHPGNSALAFRNLMATDNEKRLAASASLAFVKDGDVVGLGTGSTSAIAIEMLAEKVKAGLRIVGIPTSQRSKQLAESLGIPLTTLD